MLRAEKRRADGGEMLHQLGPAGGDRLHDRLPAVLGRLDLGTVVPVRAGYIGRIHARYRQSLAPLLGLGVLRGRLRVLAAVRAEGGSGGQADAGGGGAERSGCVVDVNSCGEHGVGAT